MKNKEPTGRQEPSPVIQFEASLGKIGSCTLVLLPMDASATLPSRGMTMVEGTINGAFFQAALEPDGKGSHWFKIDQAMGDALEADLGDTVTLAVEPISRWPEPELPADLAEALAACPQANALWDEITPAARWDWIRWIRATKEPDTRARRVEVACSKLTAGKRRPCCFNRNLCTDTTVSKNGILAELTQTPP